MSSQTSSLSVVVITGSVMGIMPKNLPVGRMTKQHVAANHQPIPPAGKSGLRANALPSFCLSPRQFFKACFHQEPDPTNSLLTRCGYGAVRFKKNKTRSMAGFVKWVARDCANSLLPDLLMPFVTNKPRYPQPYPGFVHPTITLTPKLNKSPNYGVRP